MGGTVTVYDGNTQIGTATVGADGGWSTVVTLQNDGLHSIVAKDTDASDDTVESTAVTYTLATIAPTVAITSTGGLINQATQTIAGTVSTTEAAAGSLVILYDNGRQVGVANVASNGTWSATSSSVRTATTLLRPTPTQPATPAQAAP